MTSDTTEELASPAALRDYLEDRLPLTGRLEVTRITSGMSNELFLLESGDQRWVLRRPPRVESAPGAHDVVREYRILKSLDETEVPHASPVILCEDPSIVGAPFFVMAYIPGVSLSARLTEPFSASEDGAEIAFGLIDAMASLHQFEWRRSRLRDLGRPDGFTERLVDRWVKQLDRYRVRPLPDLDETADLLRRRIPVMQRSALIHADIGLHNALFAADRPVRLAALVDWETATIGDPLLDLGHFLGTWITEPEEREKWFGARVPLDLVGFPSAHDLAARYADLTGIDISDLDWYRALAHLIVTVILEGAYARFVSGRSDSAAHGTLESRVPNIAARALAICRGEA